MVIFDFFTTLTIDDEDVDALVEYEVESYLDDSVEIAILSVSVDGNEIEITPCQYKDISQSCLDRVDDDLQAEADAEGDYRYEMSIYND